MPEKNPKEAFLYLLSHVRQAQERTTTILDEISKAASQHPEIKEALEARHFVSQKIVSTLDEAFKMLGEKPMPITGHLQEVFLEDFRKELAEIQSPEAQRLFILAKLIHLFHLRVGEYVALIAAADMTGNYGVGVLLESCLADKLAFAERTRRLLRKIAEARFAERAA
jgi:ferritin-like metal-binding protein YciE